MIVLAGIIAALVVGMASIVTTIIIGYGFGFTKPDATTIDTWVFPTAIVFWSSLLTIAAWRDTKKLQKSVKRPSKFPTDNDDYSEENEESCY
jgi:hypothetical protein